jgi:filamentous hemagglutinin family protein
MKIIPKIILFFFFYLFTLAASAGAKPILAEETAIVFLAQVTVDGTTSTTVTPTDTGVRIENGNREGGNLFHSFDRFSIPTGTEAYFNNPRDLVNIFSRVTGGDISKIDGLIRANGGANLFLINPAGIVFGESAKLQLGGSFYGSTADSIVFGNGEFSATDLSNPPLITINAPIGLNFRDNPQPIINRSVADNVGLQVNAGETLGLIGGEIEIVGNGFVSGEDNSINNITAQGATVWLGGLAEAGTVSVDNVAENSIALPDNATRANVIFANAARVDVASAGGGEITVIGSNITLDRESQLIGGIAENSGTIESQAGDIIIDATGAIELSQESSIENRVNDGAIGNSGEISVTGTSLNLTDGSRLSSSTFARGNAGDITLDITNAVILDGIAESDQRSRIASGIASTGRGEGGNITVNAGSLSLIDGALLNTRTAGFGKAGNISIVVDETIALDGIAANGEESSISSGIDPEARGEGGNINLDADLISIKNGALIFNQIATTGSGNTGNMTITANSLILENNAFLSSNTFGQGNAGQIRINSRDNISIDSSSGILSSVASIIAEGDGGGIEITTTNLTLTNGGQINANTIGRGDAGKININSNGTIVIDGQDTQGSPSGIFSAVRDTAIGNAIGIGNAGGIEITTANLTLTDGGEINASSTGDGNGGSVTVFSEELDLDRGRIFATNNPSTVTTENREGGNINLEIDRGLIRLSNNSLISAEAGANASGGNITIDAELILAFPNQNNNITANAEAGRGGNIEIFSENILGIAERALNPVTNDINASSQSGVDGSVSIKTPDSNAFRETTELVENTVTPEIVTANACDVSGDRGAVGILVVKGRSGVSPIPTEPLNSDALIMTEESKVFHLEKGKPTSSSPKNAGLWQNNRYNRSSNPEMTVFPNLEIDYSYIPPGVRPVAYRDNGEPIYLAQGALVQEDGTVVLTAVPQDRNQDNSVARTYDRFAPSGCGL